MHRRDSVARRRCRCITFVCCGPGACQSGWSRIPVFVLNCRPRYRFLWRLGQWLPDRLSYLSTGFASRIITQRRQRALARALVREHQIDVVHQPIPVSPKEPSLLHGLGVPVVMGPLNGAMDYPPAFRRRQARWVESFSSMARRASGVLNRIMQGKLRAAVVLVANERSRAGLPPGLTGRVAVLPENGVDLAGSRTLAWSGLHLWAGWSA